MLDAFYAFNIANPSYHFVKYLCFIDEKTEALKG